MKKGDIIWIAVLAAIVFFIVSPWTNELFTTFTSAHKYISSFLKFAALASMGELLAIRMKAKEWRRPSGFIWRAIVWGLIGMLVGLMAKVFADGVTAAQGAGYLPLVHGKGTANLVVHALAIGKQTNRFCKTELFHSDPRKKFICKNPAILIRNPYRLPCGAGFSCLFLFCHNRIQFSKNIWGVIAF